MKKFILTAIKGIAMGAADVVPGVSGGTIAFMTGIYKELIDSLKSIDHIALKKLLNGNLKEFWKHINGSFLVAVFSGVLFSIFTLARLMQYLLTNHPVQIWSFFFGLILASAIYILKDLKIEKKDNTAKLLFYFEVRFKRISKMPSEEDTGDNFFKSDGMTNHKISENSQMKFVKEDGSWMIVSGL